MVPKLRPTPGHVPATRHPATTAPVLRSRRRDGGGGPALLGSPPMRVAVLSDIHSNAPALEAVLAAVGAVERIWVLGDIVGYGGQPDEVVSRLSAEERRRGAGQS